MIKKLLLPLLLLILIGCSEPEPPGPLNYELLEKRDGIYYKKNRIYTGPVFNLVPVTRMDTYRRDLANIKNEGYIKNGKLDGLSKYYYENGQLKEELTYNNGKEDGPFKEYYDNGQLKKEETYEDGKLIDSKEY